MATCTTASTSSASSSSSTTSSSSSASSTGLLPTVKPLAAPPVMATIRSVPPRVVISASKASLVSQSSSSSSSTASSSSSTVMSSMTRSSSSSSVEYRQPSTTMIMSTVTPSSSGVNLTYTTSSNSSTSSASPRSVSKSSPTIVVGAVSGSDAIEKVGRWTEQEHRVFLEGLELHGKQWKTIAGMIGTRTVVQVRTHAQKYFQKLERKPKTALAGGGDTMGGGFIEGSDGASGMASSSGAVLAPSLLATTTSTLITSSSNSGAGLVAPKRKSLPPSLPSRKKSKLTAMSNKNKPRISISLGAINNSNNNNPSYDCPSPTEDLLLIPHFVTNNSLSMENLSTVSPSGVNEFDVDSFHNSMNHKGDNLAMDYDEYEPHIGGGGGSGDMMMMSGDGCLDGYGGADDDEDPLVWLIENDSNIQHLPESSLSNAYPIFPDFATTTNTNTNTTDVVTPATSTTTLCSSSYMASSMTDDEAGLLAGDMMLHLPPPHPAPVLPSLSSSSMTNTHSATSNHPDVTDNLPYTDPMVTVQSLLMDVEVAL